MKKLALITLMAATPIVTKQTTPKCAHETKKVERALGQFLRSTAGLGLVGFGMDMLLSLWTAYQVPNANLVTLWPAIFGNANNHACTKGALLLGALVGTTYAAGILEERETRPYYEPSYYQTKQEAA